MESLEELQKKFPKSYKLLQSYLNLNFGKVKVRCPYWINRVDKGIRGPFGGKGLPGQLVYTVKRRAKKQGFNLRTKSAQNIVSFMKQERIGVDCSGFAYNLLNQIDKEKGGNGIAYYIFGQSRFPDWNPAWRASANVLTGNKISSPVKVKNVKIGDIIRADNGDHVMVIVGVSKKSLFYAHSSKILSKKNGVHISVIGITDWDKNLTFQNWIEKTPDDKNIKEKYFSTKNGDGLRRFNWW